MSCKKEVIYFKIHQHHALLALHRLEVIWFLKTTGHLELHLVTEDHRIVGKGSETGRIPSRRVSRACNDTRTLLRLSSCHTQIGILQSCRARLFAAVRSGIPPAGRPGCMPCPASAVSPCPRCSGKTLLILLAPASPKKCAQTYILQKGGSGV